MSRFLAALAVLLTSSGCGSELPDPRIVSVTPSTVAASDAREVVVSVEGVLPYSVDFDRGMASADPSATLVIGGVTFATSGYAPDGTVRVFIPSVFATPGAKDVVVRLSDGRSGFAAGGLAVSAGNWPDSYEIEPIADGKVAGVPFDVTVRAVKAGVTFTAFTGTVNLASNRGAEVTPAITPPFDAGLVTERGVVIGTPGTLMLRVSDANGTVASSNPFTVVSP